MNYIPKVGDIVVVNPEAKAKKEYAPELDQLVDYDGHFVVDSVIDHEDDVKCILVVVRPKLKYLWGIAINKVFGAYWRMAKTLSDPPSLFILSSNKVPKNLKSMNTDGRATCAACGSQLRDPGMGLAYRYCPKCEP